MAKKKQEEPPKGSPAWMATFSDLMNLLLCFFVLLFSMSTVDAEKFEMVVASFQQSFSVLPAGGTSIGEGQLVSSGTSMLEQFDVFLDNSTGSAGENDNDKKAPEEQEQTEEFIQQQTMAASEKMAEQIEKAIEAQQMQNLVETEYNGQYVKLTLNGALLFDSGDAEVKEEARPIIEKLAAIIDSYQSNEIDVEGHTDNVPITGSSKYEDNNVLSMYRALDVADLIRSYSSVPPENIKSSGRGEYVPIADNSTPEGRARNRRVEIKIFNSYTSDV
ncbi:MAG: flagellar motor protein MotB [Lachnospiraceae bacterium]|nr:flagellar motor protein MotB [Lachnospiraceae bacterium]